MSFNFGLQSSKHKFSLQLYFDDIHGYFVKKSVLKTDYQNGKSVWLLSIMTSILWQNPVSFCLIYISSFTRLTFLSFLFLCMLSQARSWRHSVTDKHKSTPIWTFAISYADTHTDTGMQALTLQHTHKQYHLLQLFPVAWDGTDTLSHSISVKPLSDNFSGYGDFRVGGKQYMSRSRWENKRGRGNEWCQWPKLV